MEIFPFWWKYRDNRCLHTSYKTGCHKHRLSGTTDTRRFQEYPSYQTILGFFPIVDLWQVVEMAKRILTKEEIVRQLAGQSTSTPFMNMWEEHDKTVTFNMMDGLEQKIDKIMAMMVKLLTKDKGQNKQLKLQVYQSNRGRGQTRCNYKQRGFQDRFRPDNNRNNAYSGSPRFRQGYWGRSRYDSKYKGNYRNNMRGNPRYGRQNYNKKGFRGNFRNQSYERNRVGHMIAKLTTITEGIIEASVRVGQGQVQEWVKIGIGLGV